MTPGMGRSGASVALRAVSGHPEPCHRERECRGRVGDVPAWTETGPLCEACLLDARRAVEGLVWDYVDLEQQLPRHAGPVEHVSGTPEALTPLALTMDSLQRTITHTLMTFDEVLREVGGLPEPTRDRTRDGWRVQSASRVIASRLDILARLGPWACWPEGFVGDPVDVTGIQAIEMLVNLHRRARQVLKLTRHIDQLWGECWLSGTPDRDGCGMWTLRREAGSETVYCGACGGTCTWDAYRERLAFVLAWARS